MLIFLLSCLQKEPIKNPSVVVDTPIIENYRIKYSAMYDVKSSNSIYDLRQMEKGVLDYMLFDLDIFSKKSSKADLEVWTRESLFSYLGEKGVTVMMPPLSSELHPKNTCKPAGCYDAEPSIAFREVYFTVREEELPLVVNFVTKTDIAVEVRASDEEESLCDPGLQTTVDYIEFGGVLQRLSNASIVALIHEAALLPALGESVLALDVFSPEHHRKEFCEQIVAYFHQHPTLRPNNKRYGAAAQIVLDNGLNMLFEAQEPKKQEE